jgi:hypothetical protein
LRRLIFERPSALAERAAHARRSHPDVCSDDARNYRRQLRRLRQYAAFQTNHNRRKSRTRLGPRIPLDIGGDRIGVLDCHGPPLERRLPLHIIEANFESLDELPVTALFGAIGVYVLWSSRADVRPSYVGEGNLIHRFANEHIERFGKNASGYAAIMRNGTAKQQKADAEIVETILLQIGALIDQCPVNNDSRGKRKGILKHYDAGHNVIRINVRGYHPLRWNVKLTAVNRVTADLYNGDDGLDVEVDHPWRRIA